MKKGIFTLFGVIIFLLLCSGIFYYFENYDEICYTKVDNKSIKKIKDSNNMKFEYSLVCYKENGKAKDVKFKTSRELRESSYLLLELRILGVHTWSEVQFEELPINVKKQYN